MEDDEEPEFIRADTWMQSMVPSLPRGCAIFCLVCNIIIPGLGTFTGGVISCCYGRPRIEFRPARYRCPTAFLVMLVGVAQLLCTGFFLVGWLWSIIWGFLMLNLSDPKYRIMAALPDLVDNRAKTPIVKVDQPEEDVPTAKKNFGRLITKAKENKDQALGLTPPPPSTKEPSSKSSFPGSLLSRIPAIRCSDSRTLPANDPEKSPKLLSESKQDLLADSELKSVKVIDSLGPTLSAHRMFRRWKRAVISNVPRPGIGCISGSVGSSEVSLVSNKDPNPLSPPPTSHSALLTVAASGRRNSNFSEIISVTPATPIRSRDSRPLSAIGSKTTAIVAPENIATVNPVVVHVAQFETKGVSSPIVPGVQKETAPNEWKVEKANPGVVNVPQVETKGFPSPIVPQIQKQTASNEWKVEKRNPGVEHVPQFETKGVPSPIVPGVQKQTETNEWKVEKETKVEPKKANGVELDPKSKEEKMDKGTTGSKVEPYESDLKVDLGLTVSKNDSHNKPGAKVDPMSKSGSKVDRTKEKLEPNKSEMTKETTNKVVAKVGPLSARSGPGLTLNPTELFQRQLMKPRTKQSSVYHYDV